LQVIEKYEKIEQKEDTPRSAEGSTLYSRPSWMNNGTSAERPKTSGMQTKNLKGKLKLRFLVR